MPSTESSTIIEAPTQRIWDYVSDFGNWEHFTTRYGLLSVKRQSFRLSEDCVAGENATVIVTSNGSSLPWTITAWNPLQEISLFTECCGWLKRYASAITITIEHQTPLSARLTLRYEWIPINAAMSLLLVSDLMGRTDKWVKMMTEAIKSGSTR